ncbi:MAG: threonine synthase [bacterium]
MKYISTRGQADPAGFCDVLLTGLAPDGGLYLPCTYPSFTKKELKQLQGKSYSEIATEIIIPFVGDDFSPEEISSFCQKAYKNFSHLEIVPVSPYGQEDYLLELYHGPTLAFKDVALQLLGQFFQHALAKTNRTLTIVGATSGDTGGAAIEALQGMANIDVFILHPDGKISDVQRKFMTTVTQDNIHNIAIKGNFDDCQALVKAMFAHEEFRSQINMGAINSINWVRIMAQTVYYFTSALALGVPERELSFTVPTGNFGDIFAGYVAKQMGLPIHKLIAATNRNDIIHRALSTGHYHPEKVFPTCSPSMDIQISSNFERLIFESSLRNENTVCTLMNNMKEQGHFNLPDETLNNISSDFLSVSVNEQNVRTTMKKHYQQHQQLIDPHSAIGVKATQQLRQEGHLSGPVVSLATAHPAKFPDAVLAATSVYPDLPAPLEKKLNQPEKMNILENNLSVLEDYILTHCRHVRKA